MSFELFSSITSTFHYRILSLFRTGDVQIAYLAAPSVSDSLEDCCDMLEQRSPTNTAAKLAIMLNIEHGCHPRSRGWRLRLSLSAKPLARLSLQNETSGFLIGRQGSRTGPLTAL